jgi:hypothetical protein
MKEGIPNPQFVTFDPTVVSTRMKFLEEFKPLTWRTYMMGLAAKDPALMIDFSKPVNRTDLATFNGLFDIDAVDFFTASDEDFVNLIAQRLRPEED